MGWVLIGLALIGSLGAFGQARREQARLRAEAARQQYFPLELKEPLVYRITKSLTRRILSDKFPDRRELTDGYYSRLTLEPGTGKGKSALALRTDKCLTIRMALASTSNTKEEKLVETPQGVRLEASDLLLVPPLSTAHPSTFSLSFGLTRGGEPFFGWPLIEVVGLSEQENAIFQAITGNGPDGRPIFGAVDADRQVLFNVMRDESVRFFQSPGEEIELGGKSIRTVKLEYTGQLTKDNQFHQITGTLWLAPQLGVIKEQRNVLFKLHPRDVLDPETQVFRKVTKDTVLYESQIVKLLSHPI